MELTTHLPCTHFRASSITEKREESIIQGMRATSGSDAMRLRKCFISAVASSKPSSMLTSIKLAPSRTCLRAMPRASSYCFSFIRRKNLRLPATLQRSPTFMNMPATGLKASKPESQSILFSVGRGRPIRPSAILAMARIWSGVEPQHPPTILTQPSSIKP